jgi:hypothetical protein
VVRIVSWFDRGFYFRVLCYLGLNAKSAAILDLAVRICPSRHFAAAQHFGRFRGEVDIEPGFISTRPSQISTGRVVGMLLLFRASGKPKQEGPLLLRRVAAPRISPATLVFDNRTSSLTAIFCGLHESLRGPKRTSRWRRGMSAFGGKVDITNESARVR